MNGAGKCELLVDTARAGATIKPRAGVCTCSLGISPCCIGLGAIQLFACNDAGIK
jgi:hypothetical protein